VPYWESFPGSPAWKTAPNRSDEGLDDGYTHGFIITFDSSGSRDAWLPHPEHLNHVELVQPKPERPGVFDFDVTPGASARLSMVTTSP